MREKMISNVSNLSLGIGVTFVILSFVWLIAIYLIIKNKSIENENIDKIIELGKWFIVSVAIPFSISITNDGFREREQTLKEMEFKRNSDMKEMEFFDKYISRILEADSLMQRKLITEYFASISPDGSTIRKSWQDYEIKLNKQIAEMEQLNKKVQKKLKKETLIEEEIANKHRLETTNTLK